MRNNFFRSLVFFLLLVISKLTNGQVTPVQVSPQLVPPYSLQVSEYYSGTIPKIQVLLINRDINQPTIQVKLKMTVESQNCRLRTKEVNTIPAITLTNGVPYYLAPSELQALFSSANLDFGGGLSEQQYNQTGRLPEGLYTFTFEAYELYSGNLVSNKGFSMGWLTLADPPLLNTPSKGEEVTPNSTQSIVFNWTPRHNTSPTAAYMTEYLFTLVEYNDAALSPEAAFVSSNPILQKTITTTTMLFSNQEAITTNLVEGKRYAWRVQAKAKNGAVEIPMFRNNGISEVHWFVYKNSCTAPQGITVNVQGQRATIEWQNNPLHLEWKVEYREQNNPKAEWFTISNTLPRVVIMDLKPSTNYEYRVGGACYVNQFTYSPLAFFSTANAPVPPVVNCGDSSYPVLGTAGLQTLNAGDTIRAGSFTVKVGYSTGSGSFTGTGYVIVPWLMNAKVEVKFTNITMSTDYKLVSGLIETTYDPTESGIDDIDEYVDIFKAGFGVGDVVTGEVTADKTVDFIIQWPNGINVTLPPNYNNQTGQGSGPITIALTPQGGGAATTYTVDKLPTTIKDKDGNLYQVDKAGNISQIGKAGGGELLKQLNTKVIDKDKAEVKFVDYPTKQVYAFDAWNDVYKKSSTFSKEYERIGDYYVSQKAIAPGQTDYLKAVVTVTDTSVNPRNIEFVNGKGTIYSKKALDSTYKVYEISIVGGPEKDAQEIYAVYKPSSTKTLNLGKVKVSSYPKVEKKLIVVHVNGLSPNTQTISDKLNSLFNKLNIFYSVEIDGSFTDNSWDENGDGLLEISDDKELSILTSEMRLLNNLYRKGKTVNANTQYIFTVKYNTATAFANNMLGEMPRGKQFGYLFTNNESLVERDAKLASVAVHELGHGAYSLKHIAEYGEYGEGEELLNNIMDYPVGGTFNKFQWDNIHDPAIVFGFLQDEDESAYVDTVRENGILKLITVGNTTFLTPSGNLITLRDKHQVFFYCDAFTISNSGAGLPNGVLYGFKTPEGDEYQYKADAQNFYGFYKMLKKGSERIFDPKGVSYTNNTPQVTNANTTITFLHRTKNPCDGANEIWVMDQVFNFTAPPANSTSLFYPSYNASNKPTGDHVFEVGFAGCKNCDGQKSIKSKVVGGVTSKVDEPFFKYSEYLGTGESLAINAEGKKAIQDFFRSLSDEFKKKFEVFVYPSGGIQEGQANTDYQASKSSGNKAIKIEVSADGTVKIGSDSGVSERGVFNFDLWGFGVGNECAAAYVDSMILKNGSSNKAYRFCQKIYYGIKGVLLCSIGEQAWLNTPGHDNFTGFVYGFTHEFLETLDVVQLTQGIADLGVGVVKYAVWESPKMWVNQLGKIGKFFFSKRNQPISFAEALSLFVPTQMIEGFNKAKSMCKSLYSYYVDNGNSWRYGQLTMMVIPMVLTFGEYSTVIVARLSQSMPRLISTLGTVEKITEMSAKLNRLSNLGFEIMVKGGKKVLAPIKIISVPGGAIKNIDNAAEALVEAGPDVIPVIDDATDISKVEAFIDETEEINKRVALLNEADKSVVASGLSKIPNDGKLYIALHGESNGFKIISGGQTTVLQSISHKSLATWIEKNFTNADEVVLLSCNDLNSAQNLANKLGGNRSVIAWEGAVTVYENGGINGSGTCKRFKPGNVEEVISNPPTGKTGGANGNSVILGKIEKIFVENAFDESGKLKKNVKFQTGEFGYTNETDAFGRLEYASAEKLQISNQPRLNHDSNTPGKLTGDHAGHLIADRFGGSRKLDNLVSQAGKTVNQSLFGSIEYRWAKLIDEGSQITDLKIKVNYDGESLRPSSFDIEYKIDGDLIKEKRILNTPIN